MKKLMIAAAAAAMVGGAYAFTQVYDVQAVALTTVAQRGTIAKNVNPFKTAGGSIVYRTPATAAFAGAIWGCDCDTVTGNFAFHTNEVKTTGAKLISYDGMVLWNAAGVPVFMTTSNTLSRSEIGIEWQFLNRIGAYAQELEGYFELNEMYSQDDCGNRADMKIRGAGFGRVLDLSTTSCESSAIGYMTGYFVGMLPAPADYAEGITLCFYCGDASIPGSCDCSLAWDFCPCDRKSLLGQTAIYGQWALVYNSAYTTLLTLNQNIEDFYPFPALVKQALVNNHKPLIAE